MTDAGPEYTTTINGLTVAIFKDGGGTVGQYYTGRWTYHIRRDRKVVNLTGSTFGTDRIRHTHATAARAVLLFHSEETPASLGLVLGDPDERGYRDALLTSTT